MHGLSHWLRLDVHDVGAYGPERSRVRWAGYVGSDRRTGAVIAPDADVPKHMGLAFRIEDDIVIRTETGNENLTAGVVKKADDIRR